MLAVWGGAPGSGPGEIGNPYGGAADDYGNVCRGSVHVSEEDNNRIQKLGVPGRPAPRCAPGAHGDRRAPRGPLTAKVPMRLG